MLAEKRCKQKWNSDPRNTKWSDDRTKYGYRLLERMGWSEGEGLGREGRGRREQVKVARKCGNTGVGYLRGRDDGWIEHQEAFDQILASLNGKKEEENAAAPDSSSGEAASLLATAVHSRRATYKKRLLSKDLSVASSDDLDCVMGRRRKEKKSKFKGCIQEGTKEVSTTPSESHGVITITNKMTVQEYFATKQRHNPHTLPPPTPSTEDDERPPYKKKKRAHAHSQSAAT